MRLRVPGVGLARETARRRRMTRGLRDGCPDDVARALLGAVQAVPVPGAGPRSDAPRLLVLPKVGGTEDVIAALAGRADGRLRLAGLPRRETKVVYRALIGADHATLADRDYHIGDPAFADAKERYRTFLRPVMARLRDELGLVGVIGANVAYYAEREMAGACEDIGLPFLVLHKESIRSPRQREWFTRAYRERTGPFTGRAVAVYNRDERDSQVAGGVVGDATVVGAPRVDELHTARPARGALTPDAPIVLFAIDPGAGTWTPFDGELDTGAPRWEELARVTEDAFLSAARADPDRRFVIKAKVGHGERLLARLPAGLPGNVDVVTDGTATALLRAAAAIVAFNTTVVAEGLAAGVPVVGPRFAEAAEVGAEQWCYPVADAVTEVRDADTLPDVLLDAAAQGRTGGTRQLTAGAVDVLDRLVGNSDGAAAQRTWEWLERELTLG